MNFPIAMTSRQEPACSLRWLSPALALLLTVVAGAVIFAALGKDPVGPSSRSSSLRSTA